MADTFQKIKSSVNRGITTISVKSSSALEKSKIKTHIESLNREIEKELMVTGDAAYKLWANNISDFSSLTPRFQSISEKLNEVDALKAELNSIDERDSQILGSNSTPEILDKAQKYFCAQCGTQYEVPIKFCRKCGYKMAE